MKNSPETLQKRNALKDYWRKNIDPDTVPKYKIKICKGCLKEKPCKWMSSFTQTGHPEYKARCDECYNEYKRSVCKRAESKILSNIRKRKYKIRNKQYAIDMLGGKCKRCGYNKSIAALCFHHIDPRKKEYSVAWILDHNKDKVKKELEKCELLCSNCHMEEHERLDNLYHNRQDV